MAEKAEKTQIWQTVLAASAGAVFTLLGVAVNAGVTYLGKDRELDVKMVEISLSILRGDSEGTESEMARRFALRALELYSRVEIPDDEFESWVSTGKVPFAAVSGMQVRLEDVSEPGGEIFIDMSKVVSSPLLKPVN